MAVFSKVKFAVFSASVATFLANESVRAFLLKWSGFNSPGGIWRIVAILFALANLKNLPFVWHLRFLRAFTYHLYLQPTTLPPHALFLPLITSTRTPLLEMDYNLHKSNSTYFSDMDISRTHFFTALIRTAIRKSSRLYGHRKVASAAGGTEGTGGSGGGGGEGRGSGGGKGKHMIALGGVSCLFKKEILPYQKFEMWTRLLSWDRKWFYLVTHLVKPGVAKPRRFVLQPWRDGKVQAVDGEEEVDKEKLKSAIFATALAKYVVKKGRLTISPEQVLFDAELVPEKPGGWVYKGSSTFQNGEANEPANELANGDTDGVLPGVSVDGEWNWDIIEAERLRGLEIARHFSEMDALHDEFDGGRNGAWGVYADLLV